MLKRFVLAGLLIAIADPVLLYFLYTRVNSWLAIGIIVLPILFGPSLINRARAKQSGIDLDAPLFSAAMGDEILFLAARVLFIFPGPISTLLGASLLLPGLRRFLQAWAVRRLERAIASGRVSVAAGMSGMNGVAMDAGGAPDPFAPPPGDLKRAEGKVIDAAEQLPPPPEGT